MTVVLLGRQLLDTPEFALAGTEGVGAEVDGAGQEDRGCGRPRRGGAERRVREPGLLEQSLRSPLLLSPALLPSEDAL